MSQANQEIRCEHCGGTCQDENELQILHRSCRLKAAFPDAHSQDGPLVKFDLSKIRKQLGMDED